MPLTRSRSIDNSLANLPPKQNRTAPRIREMVGLTNFGQATSAMHPATLYRFAP